MYFILLLLPLLAFPVYSGNLIPSTPTEVRLEGMVDILPYSLNASFENTDTPWPQNKERLKEIEIEVNGVILNLDNALYRSLQRVHLGKLR